MRLSALPLIGALAFALLLSSLAGARAIRDVSASAMPARVPLLQQEASPAAQGNCSLYDSWCAYCAGNAASDLCKEYPPAQPGVASAAPASTAAPGAAATAAATARPAQTSTPAPSASPSGSTAAPSGSAASTVLVTQNPQLGAILTDTQGMTLYIRKSDMPGMSTCSGQCATTWPPFQPPSGNLVAPSGASGKLGTSTRDDGSKQVTYNDMPLYHYAQDTAPGDTKGQGIANNWFAATP